MHSGLAGLVISMLQGGAPPRKKKLAEGGRVRVSAPCHTRSKRYCPS